MVRAERALSGGGTGRTQGGVVAAHGKPCLVLFLESRLKPESSGEP